MSQRTAQLAAIGTTFGAAHLSTHCAAEQSAQFPADDAAIESADVEAQWAAQCTTNSSAVFEAIGTA